MGGLSNQSYSFDMYSSNESYLVLYVELIYFFPGRGTVRGLNIRGKGGEVPPNFVLSHMWALLAGVDKLEPNFNQMLLSSDLFLFFHKKIKGKGARGPQILF